MDKNAVFKSILATLNEIYDKKLSAEAQQIWWNVLKPYDAEQIANAMQRHLSDPDSGRFAPKPADFIAKIEGNSKQQDFCLEDKALTEWKLIKKAIQKLGAYGQYNSDDKVAIKAIQSLGGWVALCHTPSDTLDTWKRKEFIAAYKVFVNAEDLPVYAPGIGQKSQEHIEASNFMKQLSSRING